MLAESPQLARALHAYKPADFPSAGGLAGPVPANDQFDYLPQRPSYLNSGADFSWSFVASIVAVHFLSFSE